MAGLSVKLPLTFSSDDGAYRLNKKLQDLTVQNLKNLILTCPGERMMDPDFGVGMRNYLFQQNVQATYERIKSTIVNQVQMYMDYVSIDDIIFNEGESGGSEFDSNSLSVIIKFTIIPLNLTDILALPIY